MRRWRRHRPAPSSCGTPSPKASSARTTSTPSWASWSPATPRAALTTSNSRCTSPLVWPCRTLRRPRWFWPRPNAPGWASGLRCEVHRDPDWLLVDTRRGQHAGALTRRAVLDLVTAGATNGDFRWDHRRGPASAACAIKHEWHIDEVLKMLVVPATALCWPPADSATDEPSEPKGLAKVPQPRLVKAGARTRNCAGDRARSAVVV